MRSELTELSLSDGCTIPMIEKWKDTAEQVPTFSMRPDDVIVNGYPKAGTTWTEELVWLICNDADTNTANNKKLGLRYGFLETPDSPVLGNGYQALESWPKEKKRFIKSHLPVQFLPREFRTQAVGEMVCVIRNPKDVCVSFYHFHRMNKMMPEPGTWDEFVETFSSGKCLYGSWFEHVHGHWKAYQEHNDKIYVVTYEGMKENLKEEVKKLAAFLKKDLSDDKVDAIVDHCTFGNMQKNKSTNYSHLHDLGLADFEVSKFLRKGEVGDWRNHFTPEQNAAFDDMYEKLTKDWTLKMKFEQTH